MKFFAHDKVQFSADFYDFTTTPDAEGGLTYNYEFKRKIKFAGSTDGAGRMDIRLKDEDVDVRVPAHLRNLRDNAGNEVVPNSIWVVNIVTPTITVAGRREGYTIKASWQYVTS